MLCQLFKKSRSRFDYSGKKLQAFFDELDADATTKENMGGGKG